MSDEPYFPKPRPIEPFREAGTRPAYVELRPTQPKVAVVIDQPITSPKKKATLGESRSLTNIGRDERMFWRKHSLVARYPRAFALVAAVLGVLMTQATLSGHARVGHILVYTALAGPILLLVGSWGLAFGWPVVEETGEEPRWWVQGFAACVMGGIGFGLLLLRLVGYVAGAG